jgi:hypothetical protein
MEPPVNHVPVTYEYTAVFNDLHNTCRIVFKPKSKEGYTCVLNTFLVTLCLPSANTNLSLPKLIILRNAFCLILTDIFHTGKNVSNKYC